MRKDSLERSVRDANIAVFNLKDFDEYERNPSIYEPLRQSELKRLISFHSVPGGRFLDIGCGTGNLLKIAEGHFKSCHGLELSMNFLRELKRRKPDFKLVVGDGNYLPYKGKVFDMISLYGVLHHMASHKRLLVEIYRVLREGGFLYTDHDPNHLFYRFYYLYYRLLYPPGKGFGTAQKDLSEFYLTHRSGIDPYQLKEELQKVGFGTCRINFRITTNPILPFGFRIIRRLLRFFSSLLPIKSFFTHFWIIAQK
jgi:ubiquinone/menaquinone biosynthesis C-methylase UbiE